MKKAPPSPEVIARDKLYGARLAEALFRLCGEHAAEHHLTTAAVTAALGWVLGRIVGANARDRDTDLEGTLAVVAQQMYMVALGECARRPTLH